MQTNIIDAIIRGVQRGVQTQCDYKRHLVQVKPEYLLTVYVAEEIFKVNGFSSRQDFSINIEEKTSEVALHLHLQKHGIRNADKLNSAIKRVGKVDIFAFERFSKRSMVVELKNYDPQKSEIVKELERFKDFVSIPNNKTLEGCLLAFLASKPKNKWINGIVKQYDKYFSNVLIEEKRVDSGINPDDGYPEYWIYLVCVE